MVDYRSQSYANIAKSRDSESSDSEVVKKTEESTTSSTSNPFAKEQPQCSYTPPPQQSIDPNITKRSRSGGGSSSKNPSSTAQSSGSETQNPQSKTVPELPYKTVIDRDAGTTNVYQTRDEYQAAALEKGRRDAILQGKPYVRVDGKTVTAHSTGLTQQEKEALKDVQTSSQVKKIEDYAKKKNITPRTEVIDNKGVRTETQVYEYLGREFGRISRSNSIQKQQSGSYYVYDQEKKQTRPAKIGEVISEGNPMSQDPNSVKFSIEKSLGQHQKSMPKPTKSIDDTKKENVLQNIGEYIKALPGKAKDARQAFFLGKPEKSIGIATETLIDQPIQGVDFLAKKKGWNLRNINNPEGGKLGNRTDDWQERTTSQLENKSLNFMSEVSLSLSDSTSPSSNDQPNDQKSPSISNNVLNHTDNNDSLFNKVMDNQFEIGQKGGRIAKASGELLLAGGESALASFSKQVVDNPIKTTIVIAGVVGGVKAIGTVASSVSYTLKASVGVQSFIAKAVPSAVYTGMGITNVLAQDTVQGKVGAVAQDVALGALFFGASKSVQYASDIGVTVGRSKISATKVFDDDVLAGNKMFPTANNVDDAVSSFKNAIDDSGNYVVQHSTQRRLAGTDVGAGPMGARNLEDAGLYVTPGGKGSPHFLGITDVDNVPVNVEYSFLPKTQKPTVVRVSGIGDIKRQPENLIQSQGFDDVNTYLKKQAGSGDVFITKRSEIGLRNIQGKGTGTNELEAVIPVGSKLETAPSSQYTVVNNKIVAIQDYTLQKGVTNVDDFIIKSNEIKQSSKAFEDSMSGSSVQKSIGIIPMSYALKASPESELQSQNSTKTTIDNFYQSQSQPSESLIPSNPAVSMSSALQSSYEPSISVSNMTRPSSSSQSASSIARSIIDNSRSRPIESTPRKMSSFMSSRVMSSQKVPSRSIGSRRYFSNIIPPPPSRPQRMRLPNFNSKSILKSSSSKKRKGIEESFYTPSVTAVIFDIKGDPNKMAEFTGIGLRPMRRR